MKNRWSLLFGIGRTNGMLTFATRENAMKLKRTNLNNNESSKLKKRLHGIDKRNRTIKNVICINGNEYEVNQEIEIEPDKDALEMYKLESDKIVNDTHTAKMETIEKMNRGHFRKMANRFIPGGLYCEDMELSIAPMEYYKARCKGKTVRESMSIAKRRCFHVALQYYQLKRTYEPMTNCECSECYFGRPSKCLNADPVIIPNIEIVSLDKVLENGELVIETLKVETQYDKYIDMAWLMMQIRRLYHACHDGIDTVIIDGLRNGKTQSEISKTIGVSKQAINKRIKQVGKRFMDS